MASSLHSAACLAQLHNMLVTVEFICTCMLSFACSCMHLHVQAAIHVRIEEVIHTSTHA